MGSNVVERMDGKGFPAAGFQIGNVLSRKQVLLGMAIRVAMAAFGENEKGNIEKGSPQIL